jgi:diguanylate cyclase (GGDEF)-like protein/PAS domain S-box-containing protein/putative nucleotidyltransferase with HDIG domain
MRLRGHTVEEAMTQTLDEVLTPDSLQVARRTLAEEMAKESAEDKDLTRTRTLELEMYRKDGSTIWTEMTVNFLRDEENRPTGIMGVTRDISERKKAEEERERLHAELEARAITDSLTGLYDHAHFYQRLAEDIERSRRYNHGFALMMMDVDDFKRFNDSRGHQAGDEALRLVADCIRSGLRRSDLAFRYGGDEFAAILPRADSAMARAVVDRINGRIARRLKKTDDQAAGQLTLSAGIACFPDDGTAADDLVRIADDALYNAKWVARARDIMRQSEDIQSLVSALVSRRAGAEVPTGQAPLRPEALHEQHARIVSSVASSIAVALKDAGVAQALEDPDMQILATVGAAAEIKDRYIRGHPERTSEGAMALAAEIGLPPERVRDIRIAGLLHDIGKITVSEGILNKPGKLTRREFATIKEHPIVGATLVSQVKGFEQLIPIIRHHHERFDGAGYPGGLAGEEIPVEARILSVVDVFDALTHERSYRNALSREEAIGELERGAGTQFDPAVLKAFLALVERRGEEPATPAQAAREDRQLAAAAAKGQKLKGTGER